MWLIALALHNFHRRRIVHPSQQQAKLNALNKEGEIMCSDE
ncbi:hypothetical protein VCHC43A1_2813 [Vibrio cholerae HC-43A1]|nr:hypothetical protein VCHC06A1_2183 [Vibrio cholerae HC-06A1]EHH97454.1 hypothetical protein VCHC43A1_2813 [Vibrio cholerae HC-43A1]EJH42404.1 hypothetical protein VCCP104821_2735 [Vibrio cholerae CP1048(21)]EMQ47239.1 hypothetical protein VCPCS023_002428 [Vibrio cholerae O1 str. PCS-023]EMQ51728.1 hypothetical protein VCEM1676A_002096 [Vibrio cholerae O1 str. EM-1676A]